MKLPILVVEDDLFIRENLQEFLESVGFQVYAAINGREGLEQIRKLGGECIVLLDLQMPVMSGEQMMEALKAEPEPAVRGVRIVVLTARGEPVRVKTAGSLKKPVELDELLAEMLKQCE